MAVSWQPSLLAEGSGAPGGPAPDRSFSTAARCELDRGAWYEYVPAWLSGANQLFEHLLEGVEWRGHTRWMYDRVVDEPRLHGRVSPSEHPALGGAQALLAARFGVPIPHVSANLYRDGADSVAWHGDRISEDRPQAIVASLSLGATRRFLLRPKAAAGGGTRRSIRFELGCGDLLVMGGTCQATWDHSIPKVAHAGPRISVMFRQVYDGPPPGVRPKEPEAPDVPADPEESQLLRTGGPPGASGTPA